MKIINPSFEIITELNRNEILKHLEKCGRTCYKSEDKITKDSASKFVANLVKRGHLAMIEFFDIQVRFIHNRGFTHEMVRHRLCSFAQECLSGDTKILRFNQNRKHLTIKDLYERQQNKNLKGRNNLLLIRSMDKNDKIVPNKIVKVIYSGKKSLYEIKTKMGNKIKATENHIFFDSNGEIKVKNLSIGSKIYVNGLSLIKDKQWLEERRKEQLSLQTIADMSGVSYSTVRKYVKLFKLTKPLGNKPKTYIPWNKGLTENEDLRVKIQADALRENHHNNSYGDKNSNWKSLSTSLSEGGLRSRFSKYKKEICKFCGETENLENHHRDGDITNWEEENKLTLCVQCHKLIHKGYNVKKVVLDSIVSINYVGEEDTYDIEMEAPFHNFIAEGFVVHNSTRYVSYKDELSVIRPCWFDSTKNNDLISAWKNQMEKVETSYTYLLNHSLSPQEARGILPIDVKTEIVVKANLREWKQIFFLRCDKAAHPDMRRVMIPLREEFRKILPEIYGE